MLTESLVVAFAGGAAGLLVAAWGLAAFRSIVPAQFAGLPGIAGVGIDGRVLIATLVLSAVTGMIFGVVPALVASDYRIGVALTEEIAGQQRQRDGHGGCARRWSSPSSRCRSCCSPAPALLIVSFNNLINVSPGLPAGAARDHARHAAGLAIR